MTPYEKNDKFILEEMRMKKFIVYRLPIDKSRSRRDAELVAVEYGNDIVEVTPALVKAVAADLTAMPEYSSFEAAAFEPEEMHPGRKYQYKMDGVIYPPNAAENILVDFVIKEELARPGEYQPETYNKAR